MFLLAIGLSLALLGVWHIRPAGLPPKSPRIDGLSLLANGSRYRPLTAPVRHLISHYYYLVSKRLPEIATDFSEKHEPN